MSVLTVKLLRDLRRRPAQLVSVVVLVMLGVALFGASYDAYKNLDSGYQRLFERYRFADLTVSGGDTAAIARTAAAQPGVAATAARTVADVPMRMPDGSTLVGRVIGMPTGSQPAVDKVKVLKGRYLDASAPSGVLAEKHIAGHAHLTPGTKVGVWHGGSWQQMDVRGTASSTEYLWPAASRQDALPAPGSFGVLFVPEPLAEKIAGTAAPNQVAVYYTGAGRGHADRLGAALTAAARGHGSTAAVARADQPSNAALAEDIKGFAELAVLFPLLFLAAAGVAVYVVLTRRVARDRVVIGTLRASGFRRRTVVAHYLATGLAAGLAGAVPASPPGCCSPAPSPGCTATRSACPRRSCPCAPRPASPGSATGSPRARSPRSPPRCRPAASRPPRRCAASSRPPGDAASSPGWAASAASGASPGTAAPSPTAGLVLRGPTRQFRRTLYTMTGVVLALVLILVSWGMLDSSKATVSRQFDQVQRQDAELTLAGPAGSSDLAGLAATSGVRAAEPSAQVQATVTAGGKAYSTALVGYRPGTAMHRFLAPGGGGARPLPASGVLLGDAMRGRLGAAAGDRVTLRLPGGRAATTTVAGFVDEPLGTYAYASLAQVDAWAPGTAGTGPGPGSGGRRDTALVRFDPGADRAAVEHALSARPGVLAYTDAHALEHTMDGYMKLFYVFVAVMLAFGALLAFTVLFATLSVNLAERGTELATLRASGVGRRRLARLVTTENLLVVALGAIPGLIIGRLATGAFLGAFNSDLLAFHADIRPATFAWSALAVLVVAFLAQRPGLRSLARQNLAALVRERSG
ncbi:FtsX-like permease family protein [Actinomadura napierensis]|uniref:FtsX-like permease family protein n=1 Tax=Actinomadura napierensis TaxID=267854 RepID=A0ABN3AGD6_9ACTN